MQRAATALLEKWTTLRRFVRSEDAQDLVEYGIVMALIAVAAIGAVTAVGSTINTVLWQTIANNF